MTQQTPDTEMPPTPPATGDFQYDPDKVEVATIAAAPARREVHEELRPGPHDDLHVERAPDGLTRARLTEVDKFALPQKVMAAYTAAGWSLEWKRHTVLGMPDQSYDIALAENHWQAVNSNEIKGMMPINHNGPIIRDGLMLMKRPAYLTQQAREEDARIANAAIRAKEAQLGQTPAGTMTRDHPGARPQISRSVEPLQIPRD